MTDIMRPADLKKISDEADMAVAKDTLAKLKKREAEEKALHDAFMSRDIHPDVKQRVNAAVSAAAKNGLHEIKILTFPADWLNDGGRRINNNEPDWRDSLEGFAKRAYEYYENELKPLGYTARVQILSYPGGMLGEIGMFLKW